MTLTSPRSTTAALGALALGALLGVTACGGGGGGGGGSSPLLAIGEAEPNDAPGGANSLLVGQPGEGSLAAAGDIDWWRVELARGEVVQLEIFAARADQGTWDANPTPGIVRVDVFEPDGLTLWRSHDFLPASASGAPSFGHRPQDLDISFLRAPLDGQYLIRLRAIASDPSGGDYIVRLRKAAFGTTALEQENLGVSGVNDTVATAQPLAPGALFGAQSPGDVDVYSIQVAAPALVSFDLHAERGGMLAGAGDYLDMALTLLASDGVTELATSDNTHFADPRFEYALSAAGQYFLRVEQARGAVAGEYMLVHGVTPRGAVLLESLNNDSVANAEPLALGVWIEGSVTRGDEDYFAVALGAGDMFEVHVLDGSNCDDRTGVAVAGLLRPDGVTPLQGGGSWISRKLSAIAPQSGTYFVHMTHDGSLATYRARVRVVRSGSVESEPNDARPQAPLLAPNARVVGAFDTNGSDEDLYRVDLEAGRLYVFQCYAGWATNGGSGERGSWGSTAAVALVVYDDSPALNELATSTMAANFAFTEGIAEFEPAVSLAFVPALTGTYYIAVREAQGRFGPDHLYVLERR
ncbi:MAG: PPC domain-containing protein [Planctomycetes bacterium]|nr:PPC domain-containing protein [Planctomycetota bacterium]